MLKRRHKHQYLPGDAAPEAELSHLWRNPFLRPFERTGSGNRQEELSGRCETFALSDILNRNANSFYKLKPFLHLFSVQTNFSLANCTLHGIIGLSQREGAFCNFRKIKEDRASRPTGSCAFLACAAKHAGLSRAIFCRRYTACRDNLLQSLFCFPALSILHLSTSKHLQRFPWGIRRR